MEGEEEEMEEGEGEEEGEESPVEEPPVEEPPVEEPPAKEPSIEKAPVEEPGLVEAHPPDTVSYLTYQVYASWMEEFGSNILTYSKCLRKFREMIESK